MNILQRDKLARVKSGDAREYHLVVDERIANGKTPREAWQGFGALVYLADTCLAAHGQAQPQNPHYVDVITLILQGGIRHEGAPDNGRLLSVGDVRVQAAGEVACAYREVNPHDNESRLLRMWVIAAHAQGDAAPVTGQAAAGRVTRVYGRSAGQTASRPAQTCIDIARLQGGQSLDIDKPALVYVCDGGGFANEDTVVTGALIRSDELTFDATEDTSLVIVHEERC